MYRSLVQLFLKENISIKRLMGFDVKKSKAKAILIGLAIVYSIATFIGLFGYMFFDLGKMLHGLGQDAILISFICVYSLGMAFIITFFRASGTLFYYKDYEILAPLPIHPRVVLAAKMTVMMIMLYLMSFIVVLPILFSYFYWYGINVLSVLYFIIGFLFIPLIPVSIVSFLSLGIASLTARMRHAKLLNIVLVFILMIGLFMVMFSVNDVEQNPLTGQIDLFSGIARVYLPFDWFRLAVHEQSFVFLVYVILSNGIIFGLYLYFIQGLVQKTNQKGIRVTMKRDGGPLKYQKRSVIWALVGKEAKRFLSSITYATNAGFGPVILLVASVASLFFKSQLEEILAQAIGAGLPLEVMILALIGFTIAMTYTPAISLSLEGKNFWIVKSLPLKPKTVMYSKILFNLILAIPVGLFSVVMFGIALQLPLLNQVMMMVLVIVFACVISLFDSMVNLLMPKFNYVNDVEVIKQSAGALIAIFGGFGFMAINGVVFHFFGDWMSEILVYLSMIGVNLLLLIPLIFFLEKKTDQIFNKLHA